MQVIMVMGSGGPEVLEAGGDGKPGTIEQTR